MKKLLSLILALALVAGMVPATFATGTEENVVWSPVYNFTRSAFTTQPKDADGNASWLVQYATDASLLNRNVSTGEWEYAGGYVSSLPSTSFQKEYLSIYNSFGSQNYAAIVFEITVDESGYYKPTFTYKKYNRANVLNMWIASKEEFDNTQTKYDLMVKDDINNLIYWWGDKGTAPAGGLMGTKIGSVDAYDVSESLLNGEYTNETPVYIAAGKYYLFIQPTKGKAWEKYSNGEQTASAVYLTPTSLTLTRQPTMETTASKTTLAVGDSATLTSEVTSGENQDITATSEVTYTTVDTEIISIDGDMVTALAEGTATITATAAN
ncbi:MAG: Ig-like domain-containing protein, partial [Oscillospiraceae bacterium]|nr:Ig-like domain-containing protein [Oscillospiraceae bacterium]